MFGRFSHTSPALAGRARSAATVAALAVIACPVLAAGSAAAAIRTQSTGGAQGQITSISCTSALTCAAAGDLVPPSPKVVFVLSERNGVWGTAEAVPGIATLLGSTPVRAQFSSVSCSSAGNCGGGGFYAPRNNVGQAFVVSERNGTWGKAEEVPGSAELNVGQDASVETVLCPSAGNCAAGGIYHNSKLNQQVFVVGETNGVWGKAEEVPGSAALNTRGPANFNQIACTSAGNCVALGSYNGPKGTEPFAVTEKNGIWGSARTFPGIIALNTGGFAQITSVSCRSAGNCAGVGDLSKESGQTELFVINQMNGTWGAIKPIPGMAALPSGGGFKPRIGSLSCPSPGNCTAGGTFFHSQAEQPFVVTEKNGVWGKAQILPGLAALNIGKSASLGGVLCLAVGNCSAAGTYSTNPKTFADEAFVSTEKNGVWGKATELPGIAALNLAHDVSTVLSCGAPGNCSLGGFYTVGILTKPYLATEKNGTWGKAEEVRGID